MLSTSTLATRKCIEDNRNLFEDVAKAHVDAKDMYKVEYSMLDYEKILDQLIEYINGYLSYSSADNKQYEGKVLTVTMNFYNTMFTDKKYRRKMELWQMKEIGKKYLEKTKHLQTLMERYLNSDKEISAELNSLLRMTDNQYKKISKVFKDDIKIYLWLSSSNSKYFAYNIPETLRSQFADKRTPVIHKVNKNDFRE